MSDWLEAFRKAQETPPDPGAEERDREQETGGSVGGVWFDPPVRISVTLTEFLEARIGEDEQAASASQTQHWEEAEGTGAMILSEHAETVVYDEGRPSSEEAAHMARWDPARVLAVCEAKRRILDLAAEADDIQGDLEMELPGSWTTRRRRPSIGDRIRMALALPYADHPDYRDEWRP